MTHCCNMTPSSEGFFIFWKLCLCLRTKYNSRSCKASSWNIPFTAAIVPTRRRMHFFGPRKYVQSAQCSASSKTNLPAARLFVFKQVSSFPPFFFLTKRGASQINCRNHSNTHAQKNSPEASVLCDWKINQNGMLKGWALSTEQLFVEFARPKLGNRFLKNPNVWSWLTKTAILCFCLLQLCFDWHFKHFFSAHIFKFFLPVSDICFYPGSTK